MDFTLTPTVDETQEFLEIANDFSNPLEIVREAISNAFDARATEIDVLFTVEKKYGESVLAIELCDNGHGMDRLGLQSFFDLGNSLRRGDSDCIGEKGHGTKVYFNSSHITVDTRRDGKSLTAVMVEPFTRLFNREIPVVEVSETDEPTQTHGTRIILLGYNRSRRDLFTHDRLVDYVRWFTKMGSIEMIFGLMDNKDVRLRLKGLDRDQPETIDFGHIFPSDSESLQELFNKHLVRAPDHYCKRIVKKGTLKNSPEIKYQAAFCIEGNRIKQSYNAMLRRSGYTPPSGAYTVQERYGLWLSKDYIPIQRKNEWLAYKGSEYTRFHAFLNCQWFKLTANRGSVDNTPAEIMDGIKTEVLAIYNEIIEGDVWREIEWLESEAEGYQTTQRERNDFVWRQKKASKANVAVYKENTLIQPEREHGVFALFLKLDLIEPDLFPFEIIDYDTHRGIDVIAKGDKNVPLPSARLFYVEFKLNMAKDFNHSFENLHSIVCWDTQVKHDDTLIDVNGEERKMQIAAPDGDGDHTKYFLDNPRKAHKIQVYVLKDYLREKLGIEFRPRTAQTPA